MSFGITVASPESRSDLIGPPEAGLHDRALLAFVATFGRSALAALTVRESDEGVRCECADPRRIDMVPSARSPGVKESS